MNQWMKDCAKAVVGTLVVVGGGVAAALGDNTITLVEGLSIAVTALGSGWVVWYCANTRYGKYAKAVVGGVTAGLSSLIVALDDQVVSYQEMTTAAVAAIVALGIVGAVPNDNEPTG